MARTKDRVNFYRAKKANELAAIAQCMDGHLRQENERLERKLKHANESLEIIETERRKLEALLSNAIDRIQRRDQRIRDLETNWEDMAQTLNDVLEDMERYRIINRNLTEQILDCKCKESDFETEILNSQ